MRWGYTSFSPPAPKKNFSDNPKIHINPKNNGVWENNQEQTGIHSLTLCIRMSPAPDTCKTGVVERTTPAHSKHLTPPIPPIS